MRNENYRCCAVLFMAFLLLPVAFADNALCAVYPYEGDGVYCPCSNDVFCGGAGSCEFTDSGDRITAKARCYDWVFDPLPRCKLVTMCETSQIDCGGWGYSGNMDCGSTGSFTCRYSKCNKPPECSDGIDNDGDGCTDFNPPMGVEPDDACSTALDTSESSKGVCCAKVGGGLLGNGCRSAACPAGGDTIYDAGCGERYPSYPYCCCKAGYRFNPELRKCVERYTKCFTTACFGDTSNPLECLTLDRTWACCSGSARGYDYNYYEDIVIY